MADDFEISVVQLRASLLLTLPPSAATDTQHCKCPCGWSYRASENLRSLNNFSHVRGLFEHISAMLFTRMRKNLVNVRLMIHHPEIDERRIEIRMERLQLPQLMPCVDEFSFRSHRIRCRCQRVSASQHFFVHRVRALTIRGYWITRSSILPFDFGAFCAVSWQIRSFECRLNKILVISLRLASGLKQLRLSRVEHRPYATLALSSMRKNVLKLVQHLQRSGINFN